MRNWRACCLLLQLDVSQGAGGDHCIERMLQLRFAPRRLELLEVPNEHDERMGKLASESRMKRRTQMMYRFWTLGLSSLMCPLSIFHLS